jgi:redox-sensitive bicupin YhaK (pirin superfamily)
LLISPDGRDGSATIHQDAEIYRIRLKSGQTAVHKLRPGRAAWLQVAEGSLTLNGILVLAGDGASTEAAEMLTFTAVEQTEAILFDLI